MAAFRDENVGGFDVAVHDAFAMRGVERVGHLDREIEQVVEFHGAAGDDVLQRLAVEKFHGDEGFAVRFSDIVNRANVGMVQGGGSLGFPLETREGLRVFRDIVGQEFQRDETMEAHVFGLINHAHPTAAKAFEDAIVRESLVEQRIVRGHVRDILGRGKRQVNEDEVRGCNALTQRSRDEGDRGAIPFTTQVIESNADIMLMDHFRQAVRKLCIR